MFLPDQYRQDNLAMLYCYLQPHPELAVHYWRTKDGAEVDFVVNRGEKILPIEVKYKKLGKTVYSRSFLNFISRYKPSAAIVINLSLDTADKIGSTDVFFIPFYRLPDLLVSL